MSEDEQTWREDCYICGRGHTDILETHHIVPRRFGGGDHDANLVDLCPTCHRALESLHDERYYRALGVGSQTEIVDHVARSVDDALEDLELDVSMEIAALRDQITNDFAGGSPIELDADLAGAETGSSTQEPGESDLIETVRDVAQDLQAVASGQGVPVEEVHREFQSTDWDRSEVQEAIEWHVDRGFAIRPSETRLQYLGDVTDP